MVSAPPLFAPPLFAVEADAFLTHGVGKGAVSDELAQMRADWLAGVDHAPPWWVRHSGLGFEMAPVAAPAQSASKQSAQDDVAAHFLPTGGDGGGVTGQALSITLDSLSRESADVAPVLRVLSEFTLSLAEELGSAWVMWGPARMAYPRDFLAEQLAAWRAGGLIPLLAFVHFGEDAGGATITRGLPFFRLPELRFTATTPMAKGDQVRRMIRMAYALLAHNLAGGDSDGGGHWDGDYDGDYDGLSPGERMTVRRRGDVINLTSTMKE